MTATTNRRLRILLVDDDNELRITLIRTVSKFGYDVLYATNGAQALEVLRRNPDIILVLVDRSLSGMTGMDILSEIRQMNNPPPVMMMSATSNKSHVLEAIKAGAIDFVLKPVNIGKLILKINAAVDRFRSESEERATLTQDLALEAETNFTFQDISETGCAFRSSFPLQQNSVLIFESKELTDRLHLPPDRTFPVRVANCNPIKSGKGYLVGAEFVGLAEDTKKQIRVACTSAKGFKA